MPILRLIQFYLLAAITTAAATGPAREKFSAAFAENDGGPVSISPDGQRIAYVRRDKGEAAVYIATVDGAQVAFRAGLGKENQRRVIGETPYTSPLRANFLGWADNEHVVVATSYNHILALNHREKTGRHLIKLDDDDAAIRSTGRVIALRRGPPASAIIEVTSYGSPGHILHLLLRVDVATGKAETLFDDLVEGRLLYDSEGNVRGRYESIYNAHKVYLLTSGTGKKKWQPIDQLHPTASTQVRPEMPEGFFSPRSFPLAIEKDTLYFASNLDRPTFGIFALDLATGNRTSLRLEDPAADLVSPRLAPGHQALMVDRVTQRILGFRNETMTSTHWVDPIFVRAREAVQARTRGFSVEIADWDDPHERFVITIHNRTNPGAYYLYTRTTQKLELLLPQRVSSKSLIKVESGAWSLKQKDGSALSGWLALPESAEGKPRPVVVRFSPAPWGRPFNGFHREVLALAQMGFVVLEVFHRGSDGFGWPHLHAGRHDYDHKAAEDIATALDALPPDILADRTRVALIGEHYGGYLALRALQLKPELFACAVVIEPITELQSMLQVRFPDSEYHKFEHGLLRWYLGTENEILRQKSPATSSGLITKPIFLAADSNRDNWPEISAFRRKLKSQNNGPTFHPITAGVRFRGNEQVKLWSAIEDFLTGQLRRAE